MHSPIPSGSVTRFQYQEIGLHPTKNNTVDAVQNSAHRTMQDLVIQLLLKILSYKRRIDILVSVTLVEFSSL